MNKHGGQLLEDGITLTGYVFVQESLPRERHLPQTSKTPLTQYLDITM